MIARAAIVIVGGTVVVDRGTVMVNGGTVIGGRTVAVMRSSERASCDSAQDAAECCSFQSAAALVADYSASSGTKDSSGGCAMGFVRSVSNTGTSCKHQSAHKEG